MLILDLSLEHRCKNGDPGGVGSLVRGIFFWGGGNVTFQEFSRKSKEILNIVFSRQVQMPCMDTFKGEQHLKTRVGTYFLCAKSQNYQTVLKNDIICIL